jgi:hypothetical protein
MSIVKLTIFAALAGGLAYGSYRAAQHWAVSPAALAGLSTGISVMAVGVLGIVTS